MPWKISSVMNQKIEFVIRAATGVENMSLLCGEFGISRTTGYKWLRRYREAGSVNGLVERPRRPRRSPARTESWLETRVAELRAKHGWGAKKLKVLLEREGIGMCVSTINRIIKRLNLLEPEDCHKRAVKRFEMDACNKLWQMDFKGEWKIEGGWCYPLSVLDDHSRYAVGLYPLRRQSYSDVDKCLKAVFRKHGVPNAMLMDHGVPWWNGMNPHGLTRLAVGLIRQGISLIFSEMGHPQTQGKVERFHRTLKKSIDRKGRPKKFSLCCEMLKGFQIEYNNVRPHEALAMDVPASRYVVSSREYETDPPEWEYPSGSRVCRVNNAGLIWFGSRYYYVSQTLAHERVRVLETDRNLLVNFRHMYIREIDPDTGRTTAVVLPVSGYPV